VKAVQRGVLVIDDDISADPDLLRVLGHVKERQPQDEKPLTAIRVVSEWDESDESYKAVDKPLRVVIEPLFKA
jgi:hypothetical protein